jgi:hypothetical protein
MSFTRPQLKKLREAMNKALKEAGIDNIDFAVGNCTYSGGEATFKVKATMQGVQTKSDVMLERAVKRMGLKMVGFEGRKLVEYNTRAKKYPMVFEHKGRRYKCSESQARLYFS